mgnify:CR=1 FL=1
MSPASALPYLLDDGAVWVQYDVGQQLRIAKEEELGAANTRQAPLSPSQAAAQASPAPAPKLPHLPVAGRRKPLIGTWLLSNRLLVPHTKCRAAVRWEARRAGRLTVSSSLPLDGVCGPLHMYMYGI